MCANCHWLADASSCSNPGYLRWAGSPTLGAPADEFICDLWADQGTGREDRSASTSRGPHPCRAGGGSADLMHT